MIGVKKAFRISSASVIAYQSGVLCLASISEDQQSAGAASSRGSLLPAWREVFAMIPPPVCSVTSVSFCHLNNAHDRINS